MKTCFVGGLDGIGMPQGNTGLPVLLSFYGSILNEDNTLFASANRGIEVKNASTRTSLRTAFETSVRTQYGMNATQLQFVYLNDNPGLIGL